jgi:hypothetical protein
MKHAQIPGHLFAKCVDYVMYVDWRMATTAERSWSTPYEICKGVTPSIAKLHRWYTKCNVTVPKSKRKALAKRGLHNHRAESGRFIGFHSVFSSTYAVMLDGEADRLVHSINVTFDDSNWSSVPQKPYPHVLHEVSFPLSQDRLDGCQLEEAQAEEAYMNGTSDAIPKPLTDCKWPEARVRIDPCKWPEAQLPSARPGSPGYFDPEMTEWCPFETSPQPRPRPSYTGHVTNLIMFNNEQ